MRKVCLMLKIQLWTMIAASLAVVILFENTVFLPGSMAGKGNIEYICTMVMELVTVCMLPLSLRLFRFGRVKRALQAGREHALRLWGTVRLQMVCVPLLANTLLYYTTGMNVAFGYMAIILLISLAFVYPSEARCVADISSDEGQKA